MSPVGSRFKPFVKELISVLEIMARDGDKVNVSQLTETPGDISGKQLYGDDKEPWKLLGNDNEWDIFDVADTGKKATYVVTRLPKMRQNNNKIARKAGNGTWMGQTQPMPFERDGEDIAYMKSLSYLYSGPSSEAEDKSYYYLHEYYLSKTYLEKIGTKFTDYVICRIIKDTTKRCPCSRNGGNNKRCRVNDFATYTGTTKEDESSETLVYQEFPGNPSSCANDQNLETLVQYETLAHPEALVYYNPSSEFRGNPSSFGLGANDHNLEIQDSQCNPINYYNSEFTENLNPSGLRVDGYTHPYYGSTVMELQQQHQDSSGNSVAQEPPRMYYQDYEGGNSVVQEPPSPYEGWISLEDLNLTWDEDYGSSNIFEEPQQEYCSNAPAIITEKEESCINQFGDMTDEEANSHINQFLASDAGLLVKC